MFRRIEVRFYGENNPVLLWFGAAFQPFDDNLFALCVVTEIILIKEGKQYYGNAKISLDIDAVQHPFNGSFI